MYRSLYRRNLLALLALQAGIIASSAAATVHLFWTETRPEGGFVVRSNADGSNPTDIVSGAANIKGPNGLEYGEGFLWWPDQQLNVISKAKPDGSAVQVFTSVNNPYDVFVSPERVYWTSDTTTLRFIDSAKLDGTDVTRVVPSRNLISPFAVAVTAGNIYWSQVNGGGSIKVSALKGPPISGFINTVLAYDFQIFGNSIYFGDNSAPASIKRADLNGNNITTLLPVKFLHGLCVTQDSIYWADLGAINRAGLNGENPAVLYPAPANTQVRGIVVLEEQAGIAAPQFGKPQRSGNDIVFTVQAPIGKTTHVEKAAAVTGMLWSEVTTFVGTSEPMLITQKINPTGSQFFRARSE